MKNSKPTSTWFKTKEYILKSIRGLYGLPVLIRDLDLKSLKLDDIYCLNLLQPLLVNRQYLPLNGGALRPICMAYILNEIIINKRENVLEFGAGISTILMARLIKSNNLKIKISSIEHNKEWIVLLQEILNNEGLLEYVGFIHTDLKKNSKAVNCFWYDEEILEQKLKNQIFDFVIVDGPPADVPEICYSRYPVKNFIQKKLCKNFCILIDDSNRIGERKLATDLKKVFPNNRSSYISKTLFVTYSELFFNPIPLHYILKK